MKSLDKWAILSLFCAFFIKILLYSNGLADVAVLGILGSLYAFISYKGQDKATKAFEQTLKTQTDRLAILEDKVSTIKFVQNSKPQGIGMR